MRLVILGAPGAGKGTQAAVISEKYDIPAISTGEIFRSNISNDTLLGQKAKVYISQGLLVPDMLTMEIVKDRISEEDASKGFILDGFPRTIPQAEYLDKILEEIGQKLDIVLNIFVEDDVIIKRIGGRRVCPDCGASYHIDDRPTLIKGKCDVCSSDVVQRDDDSESTVRNRLVVYHSKTEPLKEYYKNKNILVTINGLQDVADTTQSVLNALGEFYDINKIKT